MNNIILITGHAASGKSTYADQLARTTGLIHYDKDDISSEYTERWCRDKGLDPHDRDSEEYVKSIRPLEYAALARVITQVTDNNMEGVIISSPYVAELMTPGWTENLRNQLLRKGYSLEIIWMHCHEDERKRRLITRGSPRDQWKLDNWETWVNSLAEPPVAAYDIRIDR